MPSDGPKQMNVWGYWSRRCVRSDAKPPIQIDVSIVGCYLFHRAFVIAKERNLFVVKRVCTIYREMQTIRSHQFMWTMAVPRRLTHFWHPFKSSKRHLSWGSYVARVLPLIQLPQLLIRAVFHVWCALTRQWRDRSGLSPKSLTVHKFFRLQFVFRLCVMPDVLSIEPFVVRKLVFIFIPIRMSQVRFRVTQFVLMVWWRDIIVTLFYKAVLRVIRCYNVCYCARVLVFLFYLPPSRVTKCCNTLRTEIPAFYGTRCFFALLAGESVQSAPPHTVALITYLKLASTPRSPELFKLFRSLLLYGRFSRPPSFCRLYCFRHVMKLLVTYRS